MPVLAGRLVFISYKDNNNSKQLPENISSSQPLAKAKKQLDKTFECYTSCKQP